MDWKTFALQIVPAITLPIAVLIGLYLFREPIKERLKSLSYLKIGTIKVRFDKEILARKTSNQNKVKDKSAEQPALSREEILGIPDNDYEFMKIIAGNHEFMPVDKNEIFKYNSLVNHGYFVRNQDNVYEPTEKGNEILSALKRIYH